MNDMEAVPKVAAFVGIATVALFAIVMAWRIGQPKVDTVTAQASDDTTIQFDIVTLLPFDAIPAIDSPEFVDEATGSEQLRPDDLVVGVEINGEARAYGVAFLSGHEIVNDTLGGRPISVTW